MKKVFLSCVFLALALTGCGGNKPAETASAAADRSPTVAELDREERTDMIFTVEGQTERVPAALFIGRGYSIYIPEEGWRLEQESEGHVAADTWESTVNNDVELQVLHYSVYPDASLEVTKANFAATSGYVFEDLLGGDLGDPLAGVDEDGDFLRFMAAEGADGSTYVIAWEYPGAAEGFGTRLAQIADTFQLME